MSVLTEPITEVFTVPFESGPDGVVYVMIADVHVLVDLTAPIHDRLKRQNESSSRKKQRI